ncbi:hypothetical protein GCM10011609_00360 [Lentzea pudingi]|uniref:Uncharacterized protein n=1 Tax=Lentzea pudingi TaxID=1789439 RepID=A0ABQ2H9V5_9PSEU|nr:hypothetical protein GCM10011609_00360 [Lentzea pudingi]
MVSNNRFSDRNTNHPHSENRSIAPEKVSSRGRVPAGKAPAGRVWAGSPPEGSTPSGEFMDLTLTNVSSV